MFKQLTGKQLTAKQQVRLYWLVASVVAVVLYLLWQFLRNPAMAIEKKFLLSANSTARFIKVSRMGERMHPWAGPWSCLWDQTNKVYWEIKTDDETIHDGYWSFSWMVDGEGVGDMGDCFILDRRCDTQDLLEASNVNKHCGRINWRLPTVQELQSLIYRPERQGVVKINSALFPNIKRGDYWTKNNNSRTAKAFNFLHNHVIELPKSNAAFTILVSE